MNVVSVILQRDCVHPRLTDEALFCLEAAQQSTSKASLHIVVLSLKPHQDYPALSAYTSVVTWTLDTDLWPQDMANNHLIWPAMAAYQGLKENFTPTAPNFFTPLREGVAYFILQAKKSGLLFDNLALTQTIYKPIGLETQARLQLPLNMSPVVHDSLERWCVKAGTALMSTHVETHRAIEKWADVKLPTLTALMPDAAFTALTANDPKSQHLIFVGNPSPVDGFDAFCDLAIMRAQQGHVEKITIKLTDKPDSLDIKRPSLKRLKKLGRKGVELNIITQTDWHADACDSGVIVLPARLAFFPQKLRHIKAGKFAFLWGTGLTLDPKAQTRPQGAYHTQSDVRRLEDILKTGAVIENLAAFTPPALPSPKARCKPLADPKVSVIILHKNRPGFLQETLESLKAQTLQDFEIIIVDDYSTPDIQAQLPDILKGFNIAQSQLLILDGGVYPGEARNQGARKARGNALFFMDDDNWLAPETLTDFAQALTSNEIVMSFYQRLNPNTPMSKGNPAAPHHHMPAYGFIGPHPSAGLFHNMMGNSFIMIRKNAYENIGGYTAEYGIGLEDYAFMLRAANLDFVILPEPYLHFREHGEKIRMTHIDWRSNIRLQAGQWRIMRELPVQHLSPVALGYARQLHEITGQQYVPHHRPRFFNLKTVILHQYVRPFLRQFGLRHPLQKIAARNGPLYRFISRRVFRGNL